MNITPNVWSQIDQMASSVPKSGPFEQKTVEFRGGTDGSPAIIQIILKTYATNNQENQRILETRVFQLDRQRAAYVTVLDGTKDKIKRFLSARQEADRSIYSSVRECIRGLRDGQTGEWPFLDPLVHFWSANGVPSQRGPVYEEVPTVQDFEPLM